MRHQARLTTKLATAWITLAAVALTAGDSLAQRGGGREGEGRAGGGRAGGGRAGGTAGPRPQNAPQVRPGGGATPGRPSAGGGSRPNPAASRPNPAASRPNPAASRPNQAASRPNQAASRPNPAASRPNNAGGRPGGLVPTSANRPAQAARPGGVNRPDLGVAAQRPGGGQANRPAPGVNRPGAGNPAAGIGNRPGGGNVNRPGGNGNRPGGLVPRASTRPAQPSRPDLGVRPNPLPGVNRPGISPPGGGNVNRPGGGNGNRPGGGAGGGNGNRPGINPQGGGNVNRPGGGAGGGNGNRPGINSQGGGNANRPGGGAGGGNGNRPGINPPGGGNVNRPGGGAGGGNANRPGGGGLVPPTGGGNGNRPGGNNNVGGWLGGSNRPGGGVGGGNINRPGGNTNINRPGGNTNINRPTNITSVVNRTVNRTNVTNITNNRNNTFVNNNRYGGWGGGYGGGGRGNNWGGAGYIPAYNNYHNDWHNGYWNGRYSNNNWNWGSFATGVALGGVTTWGFGSSLYGWGYSSYANPYYIQQPIIVQQPFVVEQPFVVQQQVAFDYAQPIRTDIPPPDQQAAEPAIQTFDRGRSSFTAGDYSGAIVLADEALAKLPNDPTIHEFRALCLFALGRFDDSAATLYPVLAVGPGWDWSTMIGLYGTPDAYTNQLRGLEAFAQNNPGAASARFLLAYHYMTAGHTEAAEAQLARAVELKPTDRLSRQLLTAIRDADKAQVQAEQAAAAPIRVGQPPADPMPEIPPVRLSAPPMPRGATLTGNWIAKPSPEVSITLVIDAEGKFTWDVVQPGGKTKIAGTSNEEDGQLTLSGEGQAEAPLAGLMTWADRDHFTFKVIGSGADDPGLTFAKTP